MDCPVTFCILRISYTEQPPKILGRSLGICIFFYFVIYLILLYKLTHLKYTKVIEIQKRIQKSKTIILPPREEHYWHFVIYMLPKSFLCILQYIHICFLNQYGIIFYIFLINHASLWVYVFLNKFQSEI